MDTEAQCDVLAKIALIPCAAAHCLQVKTSSKTSGSTWCQVCDRKRTSRTDGAKSTWNLLAPEEEYEEIIAALSAIVEDSTFRRSRKPRVFAAQAMHRIINHLDNENYLHLGTSSFGPWLMRSLQSSVRELRIASAYSSGAPFLSNQKANSYIAKL